MRVAGIDVGRIGLGTNRLTVSPANVAFIRDALAAGIQMIDTAHSYTGGQSEQTIGQALSPAPEDCIVATKGGIGGPGRGRPEVLRAEIEESLEKLRTPRIQLYYLHRVDPLTPIEESLAAIKDYQDRGLIHSIGISEVDVAQIERARKVIEVAAVQNYYNISERKYDAVVDYCEREGIPFVPFFPLRGESSRALDQIASGKGVTARQIMLAWLLHRSPVMLPIPGMLSIEHLKENLAALDVHLSAAEVEVLRQAPNNR